jgi:hypothetical protein
MLPAHCRTHDTPRAMKPGTTARLRFRKLSGLPCFPSPSWRGWRAAPDPALHSCILSVGNCSCVVLGKVPLFRPAAAAQATFLLGKVAKAIHAAACAVLRTVPCAARRPRAGANSPIHGLEHARLSLAPNCAARRRPTLPTSKAIATARTQQADAHPALTSIPVNSGVRARNRHACSSHGIVAIDTARDFVLVRTSPFAARCPDRVLPS